MSGGGETLSSISEKSCISQPGNPSPQGQQPINGNSMNTQNGTLPMQLIHNHPNDFMGPLAYVVSLPSAKYGVLIKNVKSLQLLEDTIQWTEIVDGKEQN